MDGLQLIKCIAGNKFIAVEKECDDQNAVFIHKRCGHKFSRSITEVGLGGIKCTKCVKVGDLVSIIKKGMTETRSLSLYKECKKSLPKGFRLIGETFSEDCIVEIVGNNETSFCIK